MPTSVLRRLQSEYNTLAGIAGLRPWGQVPANSRYGEARIARLRAQLSGRNPAMPVLPPAPAVVERPAVARQPSSALHRLQVEHNALLAAARELPPGTLGWAGLHAIRRLRPWTTVPPNIAAGQHRVDLLRAFVPEIVLTDAQLAAAAAAYPVRWRRQRSRATTIAPLPRPSLTTDALPDLSFGVEIECFMPADIGLSSLARLVTAAGIDCRAEGYGHERRTWWKATTDGSLGDYARGAELVSPPLRGEDGFAQVRKVCDALIAAGCTVRRSCGLHVHVGVAAGSLDFFKNLAAIYAKYDRAVATFLAPSRHYSNWARPMSSVLQGSTRERFMAALTVDSALRALGHSRANPRTSARYSALNFGAYYQHGTVEFRHHQGTVEATKVINWVKLCLRMAGAAQRTNADAREGADLPAMLDFLAVPADERQYFTARAAHFAGRGNHYQERR